MLDLLDNVSVPYMRRNLISVSKIVIYVNIFGFSMSKCDLFLNTDAFRHGYLHNGLHKLKIDHPKLSLNIWTKCVYLNENSYVLRRKGLEYIQSENSATD